MQDQMRLKARCNPTEFCNVVWKLPAYKVEAVNDMGLGHLQEFKLDRLNEQMWSYVVNEIDL